MPTYAVKTEVPIDRSKAEIEGLLADLEHAPDDVITLKRIDRDWLATVLRELLAEVERLERQLESPCPECGSHNTYEGKLHYRCLDCGAVWELDK